MIGFDRATELQVVGTLDFLYIREETFLMKKKNWNFRKKVTKLPTFKMQDIGLGCGGFEAIKMLLSLFLLCITL